MDISKNLKYNKDVLLSYFRNRSNEIKSELALRYSAADYKKKAAAVNTAMIQTIRKHCCQYFLKQREMNIGRTKKY